MGILFILLFWAGVLIVVAGLCAAGISVWASNRRPPSQGEPVHVAKAAALPFVILVYGAVAFIGYSYWCEEVRQVDIGIGDSWKVPIANGYFFCMLDVPDRGAVMQGGCSGGFLVEDITAVAAVGDTLVGVSKGRGFTFDTLTGHFQEFPDAERATAQVSPVPVLQDPNWFYASRRWSLADAISIGAVGLGAVGLFIIWNRRYLRRAGTYGLGAITA